VLTGSIESLEAVCILQDDTPPMIESTFPADGGVYYFQDVKKLKAKVDDLLSGIAENESEMSMTLDGKRLLYAYQPVSQTIFYDLVKNLSVGNHTMSVNVRDRSRNETTKTVNFYIK
jgi:hypothetical protein